MASSAAPPRKSKPAKKYPLPTRATPGAAEAQPDYLAAEDSLPRIFSHRFGRVLDSAHYPLTISKRCTNVAYDFDVSAAAVRKWLVGEGLPSPAMMKRLALHFKTTLDFLLGLAEGPPPP